MLSCFRAGTIHSAYRSRWAKGATIAFISLLCLVVVGHDLLRTWQDRSRQIENTRREVGNLSWAAGEHAAAASLLARASLVGLTERMAADGGGPDELTRLHRLMAQRVAASPVLESLSLIDENGVIIADSRPEIPAVNLADRTFFLDHKTHPGTEPRIAGVRRSLISGKLIISMSSRLNRPDGGFAGVVEAAIAIEYFQDFYARLDLGRDGSAGIYSDDGVLLVRHPFVASAVGSTILNGALFRDALPEAPSGTFESNSAVDNVRRIIGYRRIAGFPLVVAAGLGVDEQLAAWRTGAAEHLLAVVVIAVLLGITGVRLVIQVHRLTRAEQSAAAATTEARTAAAQYRLIADNASDLVIKLDQQFIRTYVSPGCQDMLGYEPEQIIGGLPMSLIHPDDADRVMARLREMMAGRDRVLIIHRMRHHDGRWLTVEASMRLIRDPDTGEPLEICAALRDITQRLATEAALRESDRELQRSNTDLREMQALNVASQYARSLLEASLDPMVAISPEGTITDVNEATIKVTGMSRDDLIGTDFSVYFTDTVRAREGYQRVFANGSVTDYPLTIRHRDGTLTEVTYNASVYKDGDGGVLGVFAAARDVTAQKTAELENAERRVKELERLEELELYQRLTVGRELKMIELKKEIQDLEARLTAGADLPS